MEELVEAGSFANGDIKDLVEGSQVLGGRGEEIGLDNVVDVTEVATGLAVAKNMNRLVLEQGGDPAWYNGRVSACRVLARAEDIEIAQADGVQIKCLGKDTGIKFVDGFCGGVGGKGLAEVVFDFRQGRKIAIDGTAGRVNEAPDFGVAGGNKHVEKA